MGLAQGEDIIAIPGTKQVKYLYPSEQPIYPCIL